MDEQTQSALASILDAYDSKQEAVRQEALRQKTEREQFLDHFYEKARSVIRPIFEEIGASLKARGHDFEITEEKEAFEGNGKLTSRAGITFLIYPKGQRPSHANRDCPRVGFHADTHKNIVNAHECTMMPGRGGQAGGAGEYQLEAVIPAIINKHVINVLSNAMGKD